MRYNFYFLNENLSSYFVYIQQIHKIVENIAESSKQEMLSVTLWRILTRLVVLFFFEIGDLPICKECRSQDSQIWITMMTFFHTSQTLGFCVDICNDFHHDHKVRQDHGAMKPENDNESDPHVKMCNQRVCCVSFQPFYGTITFLFF